MTKKYLKRKPQKLVENDANVVDGDVFLVEADVDDMNFQRRLRRVAADDAAAKPATPVTHRDDFTREGAVRQLTELAARGVEEGHVGEKRCQWTPLTFSQLFVDLKATDLL